jgi:hypothetical protein
MRHHVAADEVTPWISNTGAAGGEPHSSADHEIPAAYVALRRPAGGARSAAATSTGSGLVNGDWVMARTMADWSGSRSG